MDAPASALLQAWRERRFAATVCRELLALRERVLRIEPHLGGRALYRRIVAARCGHESPDSLLRRAEESYARWPADRPLAFRDVVHYLAIAEFADARGTTPGAQADIRALVDARIPHGL